MSYTEALRIGPVAWGLEATIITFFYFILDLVDMCFSYVCELTERGLPCHALFKSLFSLFKNKEVCSSVYIM